MGRHGFKAEIQTLDPDIFHLLFKATRDLTLAENIFVQIARILDSEDSGADFELQVRQLLKDQLDGELLSDAEAEYYRESRVAIVELMARSHAISKKQFLI